MHAESLNRRIMEYIDQKEVQGALMITAPWGAGKSHYIHNDLVAYIGNHDKSRKGESKRKCIILSLYSIDSIEELCERILLKHKLGQSDAVMMKNAGIIASKTLCTMVAQYFRINLNSFGLTDVKVDYTDLIEKTNLTNALLVFEDIERSKIPLEDLMGFVNNLTEVDGVKVILVVNEDKVLSDRGSDDDPYQEIKEKTVVETIRMQLPGKHEVENVLKPFKDRKPFDVLGKDPVFFESITEIMSDPTIRSYNLRSLKYAASRISRMFGKIDFNIDPDFMELIVLGTIAFVFKKKLDDSISWTDDARSPTELGTGKYPLHRFCYQYIRDYELDIDRIREANSAYVEQEKFKKENIGIDSNLNVIYGFWENTVESVVASMENLVKMLSDGSKIPIADKVRLYRTLIELGSNGIGTELSKECRKLIEDGLKGSDYDTELFVFANTEFTRPESKREWMAFVTRFREMSWSESALPSDFGYTPETVDMLSKFVEGHGFGETGFARLLDMDKFIDMLKKCEPKKWSTIRNMFDRIYGNGSEISVYRCDVSALNEMKKRLEDMDEKDCYDRISYIHAEGLRKSIGQYVGRIGVIE